MEKEFVPYQGAIELKEIEFDEPCFGYYVGLGDNKKEPFKLVQIQSEKWQFKWVDNVYHAPTFSQAFRWFREKYNVHSSPSRYDETKWWVEWGTWTSPVFETYEEAELAFLLKLIEIVKNEKRISQENT